MNIVELAAWIIVLAVGIPVGLGILAVIIRILMSPVFWTFGIILGALAVSLMK